MIVHTQILSWGYRAGYSNSTGSRNTVTGNKAFFSNTTGNSDNAFGDSALYSNTTGYRNTAIGNGALYSNTTGYRNCAIGYTASSDNAARTNCIVLAGSGNLSLGGNNSVRIGNSSVSSIGGQVGWTTISDANTKTNIQDNVPGLVFIKHLRPVTFNYDITTENELMGIIDTATWDGKYDIENKRFSGFIAQEVENAANAIGFDFSGVDKPQNENGLYGLRYAEFVVPLVKAVQELNKTIDSLKIHQKTTDSLTAVQLPCGHKYY
ncbi:MAG: tail fiber domain-containing protein [Bacteroidia bacterium]|nr:tail fiber domain-containing protein [Bacteroidia bacterium]